MRLLRSLLFVPGHRPRMIERALGLGEFEPSELDVAILDLEDGVPPAEKGTARTVIAQALARPATGTARYVRVNRSAREREADLEAVVRSGLDGIVVPKVDGLPELESTIASIQQSEASAGMKPGTNPVIASIESARGLLAAAAIASSERVIALLFGAEDFARDLGLPTEREGEAADLLYARSGVVVAAAAAGRQALDGIWPDVADLDGLRRDSLTARRLGFSGKSLIHPAHIGAINEVFSPSASEVEHARRVVAAFDEAGARGAAAVALDGKLLDPPIVDRARQTLALGDAIAAKKRTPPVERPAALEGKRFQ